MMKIPYFLFICPFFYQLLDTIGCFLGNRLVLNVAIRTLELRDTMGVLGVGGGIVADSDPESEYEESILKAKAAMMALGIEE